MSAPERPSLRLVEIEEAPHSDFPRELIALTDNLHDHEHVELGLMILQAFDNLSKLIALGELALEGE